MKTFRLCAFSLVLLSLLSAACSPALWQLPAPVARAEAPKPALPTPTYWDFPRGRFSATGMPNSLILMIENNGSYRIYRDHMEVDTGRFEIEGGRVFVDSMRCAQQGYKPAGYIWSYDTEQVLAFQQLDSDPCAERQQYLGQTYEPKYIFVRIDTHSRG